MTFNEDKSTDSNAVQPLNAYSVAFVPVTLSNADKSTDSNAMQPSNACCIADAPVMLSNADKSTDSNAMQPINAYDQHYALIVVNAGNDALTMLVDSEKA